MPAFYWFILHPKSKQDKMKITNFKNFSKIQILEFLEQTLWHTFCSCLIRCLNMKWIQKVLLKIQTQFHPQTEGQMDNMKPEYSPPTSLKRGYNNHSNNDIKWLNFNLYHDLSCCHKVRQTTQPWVWEGSCFVIMWILRKCLGMYSIRNRINLRAVIYLCFLFYTIFSASFCQKPWVKQCIKSFQYAGQ